MSFSFNFSGEDIDESLDQNDGGSVNGGARGGGENEVSSAEDAQAEAAVEVKQWDLKELVGSTFIFSFFIVVLGFLACSSFIM